jgi:hypothetical protein
LPGKVSILFDVDNFEIFDFGLESNLGGHEDIRGLQVMSVAENAPVVILKASAGFLTEADKINVVRGYNTYLPVTNSQSSLYWSMRTGCKEDGSTSKHYEVKYAEEDRLSFIMPSKMLAR